MNSSFANRGGVGVTKGTKVGVTWASGKGHIVKNRVCCKAKELSLVGCLCLGW
jgi:hypothetical protein